MRCKRTDNHKADTQIGLSVTSPQHVERGDADRVDHEISELKLGHANYTLAFIMSRRTTKIVAVLLALIAALVCVCGYNFVYDKNIRPKESTLDFMV